jgi:SAM-dependent methyltransferase
VAHREQLNFFKKCFHHFPEFFDNRESKVVDFGSLDINGGPHNFINAEYLGTDIGPGPNVDIVCPGQELSFGTATFDAAISSQCFEHNPFWRECLAQMARLTKPGGIVIWSAAGIGCVRHGTADSRDNGVSAPYIASTSDYYRNVDARSARRAINHDGWYSDYLFLENFKSYDTYFVGIRKTPSVNLQDRFSNLKETLVQEYGSTSSFAFRRLGYFLGLRKLVEMYFDGFRFMEVVRTSDKRLTRTRRKITKWIKR